MNTRQKIDMIGGIAVGITMIIVFLVCIALTLHALWTLQP